MKVKRHLKILELIKDYEIETQDELAEKLKENDFVVTQATISRDIRELKLTKVILDNGNQKYAHFIENNGKINNDYINIFKQGVVSIDYAQNMLVIKTPVGMAMAIAAVIDGMNNNEIVGTIAGDDTIFCISKTEEKTIILMNKLNSIIKIK
ncbi:MAG: arginine repressor [bacterium]